MEYQSRFYSFLIARDLVILHAQINF